MLERHRNRQSHLEETKRSLRLLNHGEEMPRTAREPVLDRVLRGRGQARLSSRGRLGPEFRDPNACSGARHTGRWLYGSQTLY
jgi:hypothetical protein